MTPDHNALLSKPAEISGALHWKCDVHMTRVYERVVVLVITLHSRP
jgi:hypothetical protein